MWKELPFKGLVYFSLGINVFLAVIILVLKNLLPPVIPILYGLPVGNDQLVSFFGLFVVPLVGLVIVAINLVVTRFIADIFLKKALVVATAFSSVLIAITLTKVVLLVGFF